MKNKEKFYFSTIRIGLVLAREASFFRNMVKFLLYISVFNDQFYKNVWIFRNIKRRQQFI
jgi:hypothetical protein